MPTYVALLRALNVGGRYYKMADLRRHLEDSGLSDVETHIQTGNVRFGTRMRSDAKVEQHVEGVLGEHCGFDVPAIVLRPAELRQVYDDATAIRPPAFAVGEHRRYVNFFKAGEVPTPAQVAEIAAWDAPGEQAVAIGRAVHTWLDMGLADATFFTAFKKVLAPSTNRNLKVVTTLAEKWG